MSLERKEILERSKQQEIEQEINFFCHSVVKRHKHVVFVVLLKYQ